MSIRSRILLAVAGASRRPPLGLLNEHRVPFVALPTDFDWTGHFGDERYVELMKLGRHCLAERLGLAREISAKEVKGYLAASELQFMVPIQAWDRFDVASRIVGWNEKWLCLEHRFERPWQLLAVGRCLLVFKQGPETVPPELVLSWTGDVLRSPPIPPEFHRMRVNRPIREHQDDLHLTEDDIPGFGSVSALAIF